MKIKVKYGNEVKLCASKDEAVAAIKAFGASRDAAKEAARLAWNGSSSNVNTRYGIIGVSQFAELS